MVHLHRAPMLSIYIHKGWHGSVIITSIPDEVPMQQIPSKSIRREWTTARSPNSNLRAAPWEYEGKQAKCALTLEL